MMAIALLKRIPSLLIVLFGVTVLTFFMSALSTVDPAEAFARRTLLNPTSVQIADIRQGMGLDQPVYQQYLNWLVHSLTGDLGESLLTRNAVSSDIADRLPMTLSLVAASMFWVILLTIPVSIFGALRKNSFWDHLISGFTILGISLPSFWLGFLLLLIFAVTFPIFSVVESGSIRSFILPSLSLAMPIAASTIRLFRATLLSNLNKDYVLYAKARGLNMRTIMWKHVLKNSLPPLITLFSQYLGYMVVGSAVVESIFSWQGIGTHLVNAIIARDLPTVNGCVLVIAVIFVISNIFADMFNLALNPRLKFGGNTPA